MLTKPLGTQVAVNVHEWRVRQTPKWQELSKRNIISLEQAEDMMHAAVCSMSRLNRHAGKTHSCYACCSSSLLCVPLTTRFLSLKVH